MRKVSPIERARLAARFVRRLAPVREGPEAVWLAVILKSLEDLAHPFHGADALRYFAGSTFRRHADWVGLEADAVLDALRKAELLAPTDALASHPEAPPPLETDSGLRQQRG